MGWIHEIGKKSNYSKKTGIKQSYKILKASQSID